MRLTRDANRRLRARPRFARRGMNLLEVMIVVAIIVVLVSILGFAALQVNERFKRSETELRISQIASVIQSEILLIKKMPTSLDAVDGIKPDMLVDGWGKPLEFVAGSDGRSFDIISYGRDGTEGGTGLDADIHYKDMEE